MPALLAIVSPACSLNQNPQGSLTFQKTRAMQNSRYFYRILLPSLAAVMLFLAANYLFLIPNYQDSLMDKKRETIRELTNNAWSVMHKLEQLAQDSLQKHQAQQDAAMIIAHMRYGEQFKDYFWITDTTPRMIMHPYRPQLNGQSLRDYTDQEGKKFFVEIVELVQETGQGYINYKWQWKDDSLMVVPKLSYVKKFEPWGWIVGTGIYVEDVQREINTITRQVVWISLIITLIISGLIGYLARRNYVVEQLRNLAQERLRDTLVKYKKLVEASNDGVVMVMDQELVYCNPYLINLLGYTESEAELPESEFSENMNGFLNAISPDPTPEGEAPAELVTEQKIKKKNNAMINVIINRSEFEIENKKGQIYTIKDISRHKDVERELDLNLEKFKSIADLMHLGIFRCTLGKESRFVEINPKARQLLGYSSFADFSDMRVQNLFADPDERKQVIRAINEGATIKDRMLKLRRADGSIMPALVSLFIIKDVHEKNLYCDGILLDAYDHLCRDTNFDKQTYPAHFAAGILLKPVKEFMLAPPVCDLQTPVEVASRLMSLRKADMILIQNEDQTIIGMLTHGDISRRLVAHNLPATTAVHQIMSAPLIRIGEQEMVIDAFSLMVQHQVSYVVVSTSDPCQPGYLSLLSLSELRRDTPEFLIHSISQANSIYEIAEKLKPLPRMIAAMLESGTGVAATGRLISRISDLITEKYIEANLREMGPPPAAFVWLSLGSEGRREQTLATDQDNALLYLNTDPAAAAQCKAYFLELGKRVCTGLSQTGYPFCPGGIMAQNEDWCLSIQEARQKIAHWVNTPNPKELLNIQVFFDFRPVFGDFELAESLQQFCLKEIKDKSVFFYNLVLTILSIKPQLNLTESPSSQAEGLDVKKPLMLITGIARFWALRYGVSERNTLGRFLALQSVDAISESFREEYEQYFRYLLLLRLQNQIRQINNQQAVNNQLPLTLLSDLDRIMLKKISTAIAAHQARLATEFRIS